jgi:hypothetical protein
MSNEENNGKCIDCKFWKQSIDNLHRGDGGLLDTIRIFGWCEKYNKIKYSNEFCDDLEPKSQ